jgi:SAM-dependent methyltransferase
MKCTVCLNKNFDCVFRQKKFKIFSAVKNSPFTEKFCFDAVLFRCKNCGFIQQNPSPKLLKFLTRFYTQKESFFSAPPAESTIYSYRTKFIIEKFLNKHIKKSVKSILEVGCYDGYFLDLLRKNFGAKEAVGVEIIKLKNKFPKLSIINDYFPTDKVAGRKFDLVVIMHVLEHVFYPRDFMLALRKNLNKNGKMLVSIPNEESAFKSGMVYFQHQHISYFTPTTVKKFFSDLGFKIDAIYTKDSDRILFLCSLSEYSDTTPIIPDKASVGYNLHQQELIKKFKKMIKSDLPVGLYGACGFTHNFLQIAGITRNIHIFDGDDRKEGKFMSDVKTSIKSWREIDSSGIKKLIIMPLAFTPAIYRFLNSKKLKTPIERLFKSV